jgi:hypothetical protein
LKQFFSLIIKRHESLTTDRRPLLNKVVVLEEGVGLLRNVDSPGFTGGLHLVGQSHVVGPGTKIFKASYFVSFVNTTKRSYCEKTLARLTLGALVRQLGKERCY